MLRRFFREATGKKGNNQQNDSFKEIKNDENIIHQENDENILHEKNNENMIYFDKILQDPGATPVPLTLDFLKGITNDFSEEKVLGHGGFGVVYKGVLRNGKAVALKRLRSGETNLSDEQYQKELRNLFGLQNKNIVQFKGYCADSSQVPWPVSQPQGTVQCVLAEVRERVLCFEYLPNKSLRQHISDASCGLDWIVRYEIIKGICSGLHYLHMERDIAHMDLKPENILLDDNMVPKIGDFGTSRLFAENQSRIITKNCVGSWGYMPPEYINRGMISKKADIFSFGVIILELLTGSKSDYPERKELFSPFTEDVVQKWRNRLPNADYSRQVRACSSIALICVDANRDRRPTTGYIIKKLDEVQDLSSSWSRVQKFRKIAIGVGAVVLMLLNPNSSWSWAVTALIFVTFVVTLHAVEFPAIVLVRYMKNQCSSRPREVLFTIGAILAAALVVLLNHPNSMGSWTVIALKLVTMAGVTLFAIGVVVLHVFYQQHVLDILSALFFGLVAATATAARFLAESSVHLSKDKPQQPVAIVAPVATLPLPSPRRGGGEVGIHAPRPPVLSPPPPITALALPPARRSFVADDMTGSPWDIVNSFAPREEKSEPGQAHEHTVACLISDIEDKDGSAAVEGELREKRIAVTSKGFTWTSSLSTKIDGNASSATMEAMFIISPNGKSKRKEVSSLDQGSGAQQSILALEQQIVLLSQFEHENIVQYYGTDKEDSKLYIFIELVTQGSIASLYQKYELRESQVSAYTRQILNGLVYLHERNVVHRDIKCANILVHANGLVKLADFGFAEEMSKSNMLRSCIGSVYWMAPEVINPKKTYGASADIWSLGCTVLEMLTGLVPFPNVEWINAFFMIGTGEQPPIPNNLSKEAQDFIGQCVRVDPEKRPSAAQLLEHPFVNTPLRESFQSSFPPAFLL